STASTIETIEKFQNTTMSKLESFADSLNSTASNIFSQQSDLMTSIAEETSQVMNTAKKSLQEGLGDIDSKVKSMSDTVQKELETFRVQYQENLTYYFERQNELLEGSLSKQQDGLHEVISKFSSVFSDEYKTRHEILQQIAEQHEKLQASAKTVQTLAEVIGINKSTRLGELDDATRAMSSQVGELKKSYTQAATTFSNVTEELPKAMDNYFSRANESIEKFFTEFDHSSSQIHNRLLEAATLLITAQSQSDNQKKVS
ncbi:MAG: hypothetical protein ACRCYV_01830, partial [Aeromonas sp.]